MVTFATGVLIFRSASVLLPISPTAEPEIVTFVVVTLPVMLGAITTALLSLRTAWSMSSFASAVVTLETALLPFTVALGVTVVWVWLLAASLLVLTLGLAFPPVEPPELPPEELPLEELPPEEPPEEPPPDCR